MLTDTADTVESVAAAVAPVMLQDVTKRYGRRRGAVTALDRVSLSFAAGSFTAVLGVSGDVLLPAVAGHAGTPSAFAQILVSGGTAGALAAGHPGWHVASRAAANAAAGGRPRRTASPTT